MKCHILVCYYINTVFMYDIQKLELHYTVNELIKMYHFPKSDKCQMFISYIPRQSRSTSVND